MKKSTIFGLLYGLALSSLTAFIALDSFAIPHVYA